VFVFVVFWLLTGCVNRDGLRQVKGAFSSAQSGRIAVQIANQYRWGWTRVDNLDKSMGNFVSDHSFVWYWTDYEGVRPGQLVISRRIGGDPVIHQVKAGNPESGFKLQGYANSLPDNFLMTERTYVGTYIGQITGDGR